MAYVGELRRRRDSGFPLSTEVLTGMEFDTLLELDDQFRAYEEYARFAQIETYRYVQSYFTRS